MIRALLFFLLGLGAVLAFAYVVRKPQRVRMSEKQRCHFVDAYEEAVEPWGDA